MPSRYIVRCRTLRLMQRDRVRVQGYIESHGVDAACTDFQSLRLFGGVDELQVFSVVLIS